MRFFSALALVTMFTAAPAIADCRDTKGNLLAGRNCGFDKDAKGWTASVGATVSRDPAGQGALKAVADPQGSLTIIGPCVAAKMSTPYQIGARLRLTAGTPFFCSVNIYQYSDANCTDGAEPLGSAAAPPAREWATLEGSATTSDTAKSMQVQPVCSGEPGFTVQFDDFVITKK